MNPKTPKFFGAILFLSSFLWLSYSYAQGLYTARGYWDESNKSNYAKVKKKQIVGDSLNNDEQLYLADYETYLATYYSRMSDDEKQKYEQMKDTWQRDAIPKELEQPEEDPFESRNKNRVVNGFYGFYYGLSFVIITEVDNAAAIGLPLISGGLWMLGPAINPRKYEGITQNTIRLSNTGKMLGMGYGAALGLALAGDSDNNHKWIMGLSSAGSIALSEVGFHLQKKKNFSTGHIDLMRHYSFLGAWSTAVILGATDADNSNLIGATLLAGGVSGLFIGNSAAKKYNYTRGDVDAISSLSIITTGLGFAAISEANNNNALVLIPAIGTVVGTLAGQKAVHGANLTDKQGSIINLSSSGAALVGLGISSMVESDSQALFFGVPSGLALIVHQVIFHKFKTKNIRMNFESNAGKNSRFKVALNVKPENYFLNKRIAEATSFSPSSARMQNPLVTLRLSF